MTQACLIMLLGTSYLTENELIAQENGESLNTEIKTTQRAALQSQLYNAVKLTKFGNYREARKSFNHLDSLSEVKEDKLMYMEMLEWRAFMNKVEKRYDESFRDYIAILDYYESQNNINQMALAEANLAEFYRARGMGEKAFEHLTKAEAYIETEQVDKCNTAYIFSRKAALESQFRNNGKDVLFFSNKVLELTQNDCSGYARALALNELGFRAMNEQLSKEVVTGYYQASIDEYRRIGRERDAVTVMSNLATYYARSGQNQKSLEIINEAIEVSEQYQWYSALEDLYRTRMNALWQLEQYGEALHNSNLAYDAKVNTMNYQYSVEVDELEAVYERELAEKSLKEVEASASFNRQILIYTAILAFLFLSGILVISKLFLNVRKSNNQLKNQQEEIAEKNEKLSRSVEEKELLYKELNHRVKNNLMVLSSLIYLQQESDQQLDEESRYLYQSLRNRIQTMAIVHEKLYGENSSPYINLEEYLKELAPLIFRSLHKGRIDDFPMQISCQNVNLPINQAIPLALVFNELITNSIKHGTEESLRKGIQIESNRDQQVTRIKYSDFGKGVAEALNLEKTKSMGMKIIKLMTKQLKATIRQLSTTEGLSFEITLKN